MLSISAPGRYFEVVKGGEHGGVVFMFVYYDRRSII